MNEIKIGILSDIHAEFWVPQHFTHVGKKIGDRLADADLILLAGDIDNGRYCIRTAKRLFPAQPVCLVAGNHEHYRWPVQRAIMNIKEEAEQTEGVFFLNRDVYTNVIHDRNIRVLGVTLWTDFALFGTPALSMLAAAGGLNDFRMISDEVTGRPVTPDQMLLWHQKDKAWLLEELDKPFDGLTVIMTHHAPVDFGSHPKYNDQLTPCFASKLDNELARDDVDLVVWGHTHYSVDQVIGKTRFVSSQVGYPKSFDACEIGDYGTIVSL